MRIPILLAAVALAGVAGCSAGGGGTTGSALPATGSAAAPTASAPTASGPTTAAPPTRTRPSTGTGGPGPSRCHTSELTASLTAGEPGAGQRYATLSLTNTSARACTVFGYGGLQPLDAAKKQLPITLTRDTGRPVTLIRLAPGASVGRTIHWGAVPGAQACPTPAYASIIPPDETSPLVIGWSLGPVCGGTMDGWPYGVTL